MVDLHAPDAYKITILHVRGPSYALHVHKTGTVIIGRFLDSTLQDDFFSLDSLDRQG